MAVVGRCHEAGIALAVELCLAIDGSSVDAALGDQLLELGLLRTAHLVQLVDVDDEVGGQRHLLVELVAEVHVVEIVLTQVLGQEHTAEGALAAALLTDEGGHELVAVEVVHL